MIISWPPRRWSRVSNRGDDAARVDGIVFADGRALRDAHLGKIPIARGISAPYEEFAWWHARVVCRVFHDCSRSTGCGSLNRPGRPVQAQPDC